MAPSLISSVSATVPTTAMVATSTEAAPSVNSTAAHAPFGDNRMKAEVEPYDNWIMDHIVANKGTLNYCVRWDSKKTNLSKAQAAKFEAMLTRQKATDLEWLDDSLGKIYIGKAGGAVEWVKLLALTLWTEEKIYIGDLDKDGTPQCPESCYRSVDNSAASYWDSSNCDGKPFDVYLQPTHGLGGGWGAGNFQQVDLEDMMPTIDDDQLTIVAHEIGHNYGLPDFYQQPKPPNFKPCLMDALTSNTMRDTGGWMVRRVLEYKKSNYDI
ncbi:neutral zinc metallopeptidase [Phytophthora sojae]|uniref:Neutral zinc metallopeptidase n=1 Tax=Phytophthora sojae (strain P6497) TaxID=1094619 RepID=G4ZMY4_PHYSP|nr:neutral zinc metallopeptidase [Phytophthora sojae]EGZ14707.1 neutral zinc metallopeptidase [Phytophthora sojae]|eukprot:XP_009528456.1 neutral zinc metallopeptidase [Phytophthora sojae]